MSIPRISLARASASSARQHLRLDDHLTAELPRGRAGLLRAGRQPPLRDRDPETREELLALVLVEIHRPASLSRALSARNEADSGSREMGATRRERLRPPVRAAPS